MTKTTCHQNGNGETLVDCDKCGAAVCAEDVTVTEDDDRRCQLCVETAPIQADVVADGAGDHFLRLSNGEATWDVSDDELNALVNSDVDLWDTAAVDSFLVEFRGDGDE